MVLFHITDNLPKNSFDKSMLSLLAHVRNQLAHNNYNIYGPVDMLIGSLTFWELVKLDRIIFKNQKGILQTAIRKFRLDYSRTSSI